MNSREQPTPPRWRGDIVRPMCEHHFCRCMRAGELLTIYDRTGHVRYLREAIAVHNQSVFCKYPVTHNE
jgi:hypothetical protein